MSEQAFEQGELFGLDQGLDAFTSYLAYQCDLIYHQQRLDAERQLYASNVQQSIPPELIQMRLPTFQEDLDDAIDVLARRWGTNQSDDTDVIDLLLLVAKNHEINEQSRVPFRDKIANLGETIDEFYTDSVIRTIGAQLTPKTVDIPARLERVLAKTERYREQPQVPPQQ